MNSRPLTYQSANPHDSTPLTPNHFLHSQSGGQFALEVDEELNSNPTKRWRRVQELVRHVWHRWMREWVLSLSSRKKWYRSSKNLQVGDIVLLISNENTRADWLVEKFIEFNQERNGYEGCVKLQVGNKQ